MAKILSVGEATLDCFMFVSDANVHCSIDKSKCEFCLNYADKVMADKMKFTVGGNAANTAVSFARLGLESFAYAVIGDDWSGDQIRHQLDREKVSCDYLIVEKGQTSFTVGLVFQGERTLVIHHVPRNYQLPKFKPVDWIYLTNLGLDFQDSYRRVLHFAADSQAKITFNPGTYQLKAGLKVLKPVLAKTEALFLNKEEAQLLTELPGSASMRQLAEALYDLGPKIINVTDGPEGAYAFDGQRLLFCDIFPIEVVERTGTGDAYSSAFTAALASGLEIEQAMRWGMANSAGVVNKIGPQEGLLTDEELASMLNKHRRVQPVEVGD
ncbi:MAG: carbohydrate kinase family protein [Patescibacteria group bacterium]